MYVIEINKLHVSKKLKKTELHRKKQNMIELSDQNMATNPQCYKDREDYSRRSSSLLCGLNIDYYLKYFFRFKELINI